LCGLRWTCSAITIGLESRSTAVRSASIPHVEERVLLSVVQLADLASFDGAETFLVAGCCLVGVRQQKMRGGVRDPGGNPQHPGLHWQPFLARRGRNLGWSPGRSQPILDHVV
jgi:hypothetical protein